MDCCTTTTSNYSGEQQTHFQSPVPFCCCLKYSSIHFHAIHALITISYFFSSTQEKKRNAYCKIVRVYYYPIPSRSAAELHYTQKHLLLYSQFHSPANAVRLFLNIRKTCISWSSPKGSNFFDCVDQQKKKNSKNKHFPFKLCYVVKTVLPLWR